LETWKRQLIQVHNEKEINKQKTHREIQFVSAYWLFLYFFCYKNELITITVFSL
jgi:hypothetical protein